MNTEDAVGAPGGYSHYCVDKGIKHFGPTR